MPIGLGTDWTASNNAMDMLAEARLAALVGKMRADDPQVLPVQQMVRMLTIDGARALGLDGLSGSIEAGKRADLVVFDGNKLEATPAHDPAANLIYSLNPRAVRDVLVDGAAGRGRQADMGDDEAALACQQRTRGALPDNLLDDLPVRHGEHDHDGGERAVERQRQRSELADIVVGRPAEPHDARQRPGVLLGRPGRCLARPSR